MLYGFRPKRSALGAKEMIRVSFIKGFTAVAEAHIRGFFDNIAHERLLAEVGAEGLGSADAEVGRSVAPSGGDDGGGT